MILNPYLALVIGVLGVSSSAILVKLTTAPPVIIAGYRLLFTVLMLLPFAILKSSQEFKELKRGHYLWSLASGLFLALHFLSWFGSLKYTSVASASVLVNTQPLFVILFSYLLWRETIPAKAFLGIFIAIAGIITLSWGDFQLGVENLRGNLLAIVGAFMVAGYYLCGRHLRKTMGILPYTTLVYGFSTIILIVFALIGKYPLTGYSREDLLIFLALAFFCTIIGHTILNWALKYLPAASVSLSILGEPVIASVMAFFILQETLNLQQILGCALVLAGIYYYITAERQKTLSNPSKSLS